MLDHFRLALAKGIENRFCPPDEDAGVPVVISVSEILFGSFRVGLFAKLHDAIRWRFTCAARQFLSAQDVAKDLRGVSRRDAEGNDTLWQHIDHALRLLDCGSEFFSRLDHVVGRHDGHRGFGIVARDEKRRQRDAGGRIALARFADNGLAGKLRQLLAHGWHKSLVGYDKLARRRHKFVKPIDRLADHGFVADEREKLFGSFGAAGGPEAGACAAGHDDCVKHNFGVDCGT